MLWLSRRPEWQRSREFETTIRSGSTGTSTSQYASPADSEWDDAEREWEAYNDTLNTFHTPQEDDTDPVEKPKTRIIFQPTYDTTHTIFFRGHWLRVKRSRKLETNSETISISVIARSNNILKQLVLQAKKEYEAECVHRIQIYFADAHGSWRWTDSRAKRPLSSIVLNPGVKEMLVDDAKDFLRSEKWYADRGIPFRRGYLLYGVPGSGKSSLIHALAGYLQLDIYVVSLSASWISDSTLTSLMGRVPARCVVLLEDLDAAFTRSVSRDDEDEALLAGGSGGGAGGKNGGGGGMDSGPQEQPSSGFSSFYGTSGGRRRGGGRGGRSGEYLSDVNTLSLSGLLNALDGVAASEGRLLFATTNHLDKLDEALRRPGRMDVWIEFKNASKWQAEALFRNFFPAAEEEDDEAEIDEEDDGEGAVSVEEQAARRRDARDAQRRREKEVEEALRNIHIESRSFVPSLSQQQQDGNAPASPASSVWSIASSATNLLSGASSLSLPFGASVAGSARSTPSLTPASSKSTSRKTSSASSGSSVAARVRVASNAASNAASNSKPNPSNPSGTTTQQGRKFGDTNTAYIAPPPEPEVTARSHSAAPLDKKTLAVLAKTFADGVPEGEFSVAGLQGYLLKHKSNPHLAASNIPSWVSSERLLRIKLAQEKAQREEREKAQREKRRQELILKREEKKKQEEKEAEMEKIKAKLAEKEKEEELEKMRQKLREKEEEGKNGASSTSTSTTSTASTTESTTESSAVVEGEKKEEKEGEKKKEDAEKKKEEEAVKVDAATDEDDEDKEN
ncbi:P-loop containing nucleoside triphosphate hydrolase protein [Coprinopsis marcescibilis]|uniref:P-loop containing nucleoside triphosphate hydrolase protein n=1 Tax=Coprinopsis marcescibilis TaxID=230819 RepID=A0A5C3KKB2_COPMA|nr:P-loop containing nucleoside triphosphate hydrolase protein [Coprinopsis marcescibilis]